MKGEWPRAQIDHKNHDGFDDRWDNLREANHGQNNVNKKGWGKSGYKGVTQSLSGRFYARLCIKGKYTHLGTFDTALAASKAHDAKARELYGEFAR